MIGCPRRLGLGLLLLGALAFGPAAARAEGLKDSVPSITVMGHARMEIVPNMAVLSLAVVTERPHATDAAADNARAAQDLIENIKTQGIDAKDIQTVSVTLDPIYDEDRDANGHLLKRILRGYQARTGMTVRVHAIDKAGVLARQLIDKGANEFQGIVFDSDEKEAAFAKLRGEAMQDALNKAKAYVAPVELRLARILQIAPFDSDRDKLVARYAMDSGGLGATPAPASIPIEPGTLILETQVQVTWEVSP